MKGILFVEFIDYLESQGSPDQTQEIINRANLESQGAYSRVGLYDYQELISLLIESASSLNTPAEELLDGFADHLMSMFSENYAGFFESADCAADMLLNLDSHIHVEVKKLYPDAELPKFTAVSDDKLLTLEYSSPRPLAGVALALTKACIKHFGRGETLIETTVADDQCSANFKIRMS